MDISEFSRLDDQSKYNRHPWETSRKIFLHTFLKQSDINFPIKRIVDIDTSGNVFGVNYSTIWTNLSGITFNVD